MQLAVVEFARNKLAMNDAHSTEFNPDTSYPVIGLITEWKTKEGQINTRNIKSDLGGSMRLGGQECFLKANSLSQKIYGTEKITERHRHRYEVNSQYISQLEKGGLHASGLSAEDSLCEIIELPRTEHPWFVGCQFHPEFTSTPRAGHPLFKSFVEAAINASTNQNKSEKVSHDKLKMQA
jgi:CTP synthase